MRGDVVVVVCIILFLVSLTVGGELLGIDVGLLCYKFYKPRYRNVEREVFEQKDVLSNNHTSVGITDSVLTISSFPLH